MSLAFVFPGQGAQAVGMARDFYDVSPAARAALERIDAACGFSVTALCFDGPEEALKQTRNTQPALYAAHIAAWSACVEAGLTPTHAAGHSIGEYAALTAAGALSIEEGARLVRARAEAMEAAAGACDGTMAAVLGLDAAVVRDLCAAADGVVVAANDNCPGQVVVSGERAAVEAVSVALKEAGARKVVALSVSGAFHSPLMAPAADALRAVLMGAVVASPTIPVVANVTADYVAGAGPVRECLAEQVDGPVRWTETIQRLVGDGVTTFVECGPGTVLAGLIKRIAPEARTVSVSDTATLARAREALGV